MFIDTLFSKSFCEQISNCCVLSKITVFWITFVCCNTFTKNVQIITFVLENTNVEESSILRKLRHENAHVQMNNQMCRKVGIRAKRRESIDEAESKITYKRMWKLKIEVLWNNEIETCRNLPPCKWRQCRSTEGTRSFRSDCRACLRTRTFQLTSKIILRHFTSYYRGKKCMKN